MLLMKAHTLELAAGRPRHQATVTRRGTTVRTSQPQRLTLSAAGHNAVWVWS